MKKERLMKDLLTGLLFGSLTTLLIIVLVTLGLDELIGIESIIVLDTDQFDLIIFLINSVLAMKPYITPKWFVPSFVIFYIVIKIIVVYTKRRKETKIILK